MAEINITARQYEIHNKIREASKFEVSFVTEIKKGTGIPISQKFWKRVDKINNTIETALITNYERYTNIEIFNFLSSPKNIGSVIIDPESTTPTPVPNGLTDDEKFKWVVERILIIRDRLEYLTTSINSQGSDKVMQTLSAVGAVGSLAFPPSAPVIAGITGFISLFVTAEDKVKEKSELLLLGTQYEYYAGRGNLLSEYLTAIERQELQIKFGQKYTPVVPVTPAVPAPVVASTETQDPLLWVLLIGLVIGAFLFFNSRNNV